MIINIIIIIIAASVLVTVEKTWARNEFQTAHAYECPVSPWPVKSPAPHNWDWKTHPNTCPTAEEVNMSVRDLKIWAQLKMWKQQNKYHPYSMEMRWLIRSIFFQQCTSWQWLDILVISIPSWGAFQIGVEKVPQICFFVSFALFLFHNIKISQLINILTFEGYHPLSLPHPLASPMP